jgi:sialate O-acetylesterase
MTDRRMSTWIAVLLLALPSPALAAEAGLLGHWIFSRAHVQGQTVKAVAGKQDVTVTGPLNIKQFGDMEALACPPGRILISRDYKKAAFPAKQITAEAWVQVSNPQIRWGGIVGIFQDNGPHERGWLLGYGQGRFNFAVKAKSGGNVGPLTYLAANKAIRAGDWYHVVGTYDGTTMHVYVNGKQAAKSTAQNGDIDYPANAFYEIGSYHDNDEDFKLSGAIHSVAVFDRALSAKQVKTRYKAGKMALPGGNPLRLASIFGDHMVLQRGQKLRLWGESAPEDKILVTIDGQRGLATADAEGKWRAMLPPLKAGGPHTLTITGEEHKRTYDDVLVGEVWICSGQSNMQWAVAQSAEAGKAIPAADQPKIRLLTVPNVMAPTPNEDVSAAWQACTPQTVRDFSAVGYFFGLKLHRELDVPVGLIDSSWGGSLCEAWMSREALKANKSFRMILERARANLWHGTGMYNAMIAPLIPYGIRGAIWYQGESNVTRAAQYETLFPAMIKDWRTRWGREFPFLYVQLAPFNYGGNNIACAELWEAQLKTLSVPNTGMAVTVDIGNVRDIHPRRKQPVGERLALWALAKTYGQKGLVYSGPLYKSMSVEGGKVRLAFDHADGLKTTDGNPPNWFTIAGEDETFHAATAEIDGKSVVVRSDQVEKPVAVRFAWTSVAQPNLVNGAGLPAAPFRTDDWKRVTEGRQ